MCEKLLRFNFATNQLYAPGEIVLLDFVNAISVKNNGTTNVIFQGDIIGPGESKTVGGNRKEILHGRIDLNFQVPTPAPSTITNSCTVTQKYYLFTGCNQLDYE